MHFFGAFSATIVASLVALSHIGSGVMAEPSLAASNTTDVPLPRFEHLFSVEFNLGTNVGGEVNGPFGQRVLFPILAGNLSDPNGTRVGEIMPWSAEWGLNAAEGGAFFPNVYMAVQWVVDEKFAYVHIQGVGTPFVGAPAYLHLETDSPSWESLNGRFMLANASLKLAGVGDGISRLNIYGLLPWL